MTPVERGGAWYHQKADGTWLVYNEATGAWTSSEPPPPAPPAAPPPRRDAPTRPSASSDRAAVPRPARSTSLAPPPTRRTPQIVAAAVAAIVLVLAARYFLTRPLTFDEHGVTFSYPRTWSEVSGSFTPPAGIDLLWADGVALDDDNGIGVAAARIDVAVPDAFLESAARTTLEPAMTAAVEAAGGSLTGPRTSEIADRRALVYEATDIAAQQEVVSISLAVLADGSTVYFIACQSTVAGAEEVDDACALAHDTFGVGS